MADTAKILDFTGKQAGSAAGASESEPSSPSGALGEVDFFVGFPSPFESTAYGVTTWAPGPPTYPPGFPQPFGNGIVWGAGAAEATSAGFRRRLLAALEAQPVEDGTWHPAEDVLRWAVGSFPLEAGRWVSDVYLDLSDQPDVAAGLLQCLSRLASSAVGAWGARLVKNGLRHQDVAVREAAVIAAEAWGEPALLDLLRTHREPEGWLAEYVEQVLQDFD